MSASELTRPFRLVILCFLLLLLHACTVTGNSHRTHESLRAEPGPPRLPASVVVLDGHLELTLLPLMMPARELPVWQQPERTAVRRVLIRHAQGAGMQVRELPPLGEHQRRLLDEHLALYQAVVDSAYSWQRLTAMVLLGVSARRREGPFDLTIGPGLAFLAEETGAEAALIITERDLVISVPRGWLFQRPPAGVRLGLDEPELSPLTVGLIDLRTGTLLWSNRFDDRSGVRRRLFGSSVEHTERLVEGLLTAFPNGQP